MLQRHPNGRIGSLTCLLPLMCRWSISSGTQRAELPLFLFFAVDVPLEVLQRHSNGRIGSLTCLLPLMCRWSISSGTQRAELALFLFIAVEVPLETLQGHSNGRSGLFRRCTAAVSTVTTMVVMAAMAAGRSSLHHDRFAFGSSAFSILLSVHVQFVAI